MKSVSFRFHSEVILELQGESYEKAYQQFLTFCKGEQPLLNAGNASIQPWQGGELFVAIDQHALHEITNFTGDFEHDVVQNSVLLKGQSQCPSDALSDWHFHAQ